MRGFFRDVAAHGDQAKGRGGFELGQFDGAGAHGERGGVAAEIPVRPDEFDDLGLEFGRERDVGGGERGTQFHAEDFGAFVQDEIAALGIEVGEFVVFLRADVRDGSEVTGAVVGDDFVLTDRLDVALREGTDFFFELCQRLFQVGVFSVEVFEGCGQGFDFGPAAFGVGEE